MNKKRTFMIVTAGLMILITGCEENEQVARVATEAANRQASQNQEMARLNREVAEGTKTLVAADAKARTEIVAAQKELHAQQPEVGHQRDQLEVERKEIVSQRQTELLLAPVLQGLGILLFGGLVIGLCWYLLHGLRNDGEQSQELSELLVMELSTNATTSLPGPGIPSPPRLESDGSLPALPAGPSDSDPQP